jgi:hypothetical protein
LNLHRLPSTVAVALLLAFTAAACEGIDLGNLGGFGKSNEAPPGAGGANDDAATKGGSGRGGAAVAVAVPPVKPAVPPKPGTAEFAPAQLVGLGQEEAVQLFGPAAAVREVPPATVWEYRADGCVLDLFFYMDVANKRYRSLAYDLKPSDGINADAAIDRCLSRLRDRGHGS